MAEGADATGLFLRFDPVRFEADFPRAHVEEPRQILGGGGHAEDDEDDGEEAHRHVRRRRLLLAG